MNPADHDPAVLELAQIIYSRNLQWARRQGMQTFQMVAFNDLPRCDMHIIQAQWIDVAAGAIEATSFHHFPANAVDVPEPLPPFRQRIYGKLQELALDNVAMGWSLICFALGILVSGAWR